MRLIEIFQTQSVVTNLSQPFDYDSLERQALRDVDRYGADGGTARGRPDRDPHLYKKIYKEPTAVAHDPYIQYIRSIKDLADSNPFLPRIYRIEYQRDPDWAESGLARPIITIERLYHHQSFTQAALLALGRSLFVDFDHQVSIQARRFSGQEYRFLKFSQRDIVWKAMAAMVNRTIDDHSVCRNPLLVQALELVKKIKENNSESDYDIHSNNIMLRNIGSQLQLVITDPLEYLSQNSW